MRTRLNDEHLWQYLLQQDRYTVEEFGIGIVGIGALLWAYGSVAFPYLKELIAWLGLGGSFILWSHIFGALKEHEAFTETLRSRNESFFRRLHDARRWRVKGWCRLIYHPVVRLMKYFMLLVSWGWFTLILYHRGVSVQILGYLDGVVFIFTMVLVACLKIRDVRHPERYAA